MEKDETGVGKQKRKEDRKIKGSWEVKIKKIKIKKNDFEEKEERK